MALATSALTQAVFPWGYPDLLDGGATTTAVLVVRNGLLLVLLGCATVGVRTAMRQDPYDPGRREDVLSRAGA